MVMFIRGVKMIFKGKRPVCVVHKKISGESACICGAKLENESGDWIHPEVKKKRASKKGKYSDGRTWERKIILLNEIERLLLIDHPNPPYDFKLSGLLNCGRKALETLKELIEGLYEEIPDIKKYHRPKRAIPAEQMAYTMKLHTDIEAMLGIKHLTRDDGTWRPSGCDLRLAGILGVSKKTTEDLWDYIQALRSQIRKWKEEVDMGA